MRNNKKQNVMSSCLKILLVFQVTTFAAAVSIGQVCSPQFTPHSMDIGFFLSSKQKQILLSPQLKAQNAGVSRGERLERVEKHIPKYRGVIAEISNESLAKNIVNAAAAVGIDFSILSSVIRKESVYCKLRHNKKGGDSGCLQFTSSGLNELKHQFGLAGPKNNSAGVPATLKSFVSKYFANQPDREKIFYNWLGSSIANQKVALRGSSIIDVDVLAGALLLKIYLSVSNGNYISALRQYNSSAKKIAYASDANAVSTQISFELNQCLSSALTTDQILLESCEIDNDANCFLNEESFSQPLPGGPFHVTQSFKMASPLKFPLAVPAVLKRSAVQQ